MNNLEVESKPMLKTSKFLIDELIGNLQFSIYNLAIIIVGPLNVSITSIKVKVTILTLFCNVNISNASISV